MTATWLPLVLILIVWLVISRKYSGRLQQSEQRTKQVMASNDELIALNRQMAGSLRNIEKLLEDRNS